MTTKNQSESSQEQEFDLRHRVTGAAVLLLLGALIIPWLLGPPSEASKRVDSVDSELAEENSPSELEDRLLAELDADNQEPEETVYISKITPLNVDQEEEIINASIEEAEADKASPKQPEQEVVKTEPKTEPAEKEVASDKKAATQESAQEKRKKAEALAREKEKAEQLAKEKRENEQREKELQAALAAESKQSNSGVDVGWVVQVGLYLEKSGAETKIKELSSQGFKASSTIVDTNRGPKTGTRVWLGPFAKRAEAEQENAKLVQRTKKDGFIRVYP